MDFYCKSPGSKHFVESISRFSISNNSVRAAQVSISCLCLERAQTMPKFNLAVIWRFSDTYFTAVVIIANLVEGRPKVKEKMLISCNHSARLKLDHRLQRELIPSWTFHLSHFPTLSSIFLGGKGRGWIWRRPTLLFSSPKEARRKQTNIFHSLFLGAITQNQFTCVRAIQIN